MSYLPLAMTLLLSAAMLALALVTITTNRIGIAILAAGSVSLTASIVFLLLASPDVAMTEAAIGSGLTTFLFFFVLGRVRERKNYG
jgi:energy-converting hydrogenase B subunit D